MRWARSTRSTPSRRYTGLSGYKRLLESKLDAVVIETPPYFHPQHAAAAVDAGKHVYLAKPIAVDAPGCQTIADAGQRATAKKQVFLVDFQTRANEHFRDAIGQVHKGAMGPLVMAEAWYPWSGGGRGEPPATPEQQLRSWYYVLPLSGDFIVEQSIHALDLATWIINADPIARPRHRRPQGAPAEQHLRPLRGHLLVPGRPGALVHLHPEHSDGEGRDPGPGLWGRRVH